MLNSSNLAFIILKLNLTCFTMKIPLTIQHATIESICCLYSLLFIYAATSKLIDFENFQVQLGQSPILGAFAGVVSWMVPVIEIIISICLWIPRLRIASLFCCYTLMLMFTGDKPPGHQG
jgi:hypothetical protein